MKIKPSDATKPKPPRLASRATRTNAAGRKLMTALQEIIEAERTGGHGLIVRKVDASGITAKK